MTSEPRPRGDQYRILKDADLRDFLSGLPEVAARLGGQAAGWTIDEVGDGNLNLVFIIKGPKGGIAVKQALPYVRLVGESWPLPLSRSHYEYLALTQQARLVPGAVPAILHHNEAFALVAMELLAPHIIMRKGLVAGTTYPRFVEDISTFLARTLFFSSDLALPAAEKKYGPGVGDTEIKIGNTMPYSGPLSTAATIGRTEAAYFQMLNKRGGVNGRKHLHFARRCLQSAEDRRAGA